MAQIESYQKKVMECEQEIGRGIIGQKEIVRQVMLALLSGGNVLLEGMPGLGKTMLVRTVAQVFLLSFKRIQFTPDLMPSDVTGTNIMVKEEGKSSFRFERGPIFANLVLADEINRTAPKTQASLLEAMAEGQVTVDGTVHGLPRPFMVIATQNPVEFLGTYPLPEAQMDRFMMRLSIGYPGRAEEIRMAEQFLAGRTPQRVEAVCCGEDVLRMKEQVRAVKVRESVLGYMEDLVALTRQEPRFVLGASPRALLALLRASQGKAFLLGRDYVKPDDVKAVARQVLLHRLTLSSEARVQKADGGAVLQSLILKAKVPV